MGKATILEHKGDGLYSVRLTKSSLHITDRLAAIEIDLQAVEADIQAADSQIEVDEASLSARKAEIDEEIGRINAKYAELSATIRAEREELADAVSSLRIAQEFLDYLEQLEEDGVEVGKQQMDYAEEQVAKKTAERDAVQDRLNAHQTEWADREKDLTAIGALVKSSAELTEAARIARMMLADLVNQRTQLMADRLWLMGKMPGEETVDAWCADLTTDLEGVVGTIEALGERVHQTGTLLVRPGYDGGADYKSAEQFKPLIDALSAAQVETLRSVERVDAAEAALDANRRRIDDLTRQLADLLDRPQQTDDEYGYLLDLDGNPIPQPRGITPAEIVFVQGQLDAAQKQTPYLEGSLAIMQESLATAREAYDVAHDALDAAREAEQKPRNADGLLQSVAAAPGPFSWFFNQALLPAWEKWKPMYRLGEIAEIDADTCSVALDSATSSEQSIDINREDTLEDVPIVYMECNGDAFEVGDRVVVEFAYHDQTKPRVIGFESNPQACRGRHGIYITPASSLSPIGFGAPYTEGGAPINDGWGKSGVTADSRILPSELPPANLRGGKGFQCLIVPGATGDLYLYGAGRNSAILSEQTVLGGAVAVTGPLDASVYGTDGRPKPTARFDVYSIANNYLGPFNTWHVNYRIKQFDAALQSEGIAAMDGDTSILGSHPWRFGQNDVSKIYKNGAEMAYTVTDPAGVGVHSDGYTYKPLSFAAGLAIKNVTVEAETIRRMIGLFVAGRQQFEGTIFYHHYLLAWADPPYSSFLCSQLIDLDYPNFESFNTRLNREFPYQTRMVFHANESGTRMSAVAGGFPPDFDDDYDGTPVLVRVIHLDISDDGKTCTIVEEPRAAIPPATFNGAPDTWDGSGDIPPPGFSSVQHSESEPVTYAIAYDRDVEKRLTIIFSRTYENSRTGAGWAYTERSAASFQNRFQIGGTVVEGGISTVTTVQHFGDGSDPKRTVETHDDIPLLLGVDFIHDRIYHEVLKTDSTTTGEPGSGDYTYTIASAYELRVNSESIWTGAGTLTYPDVPPASDTAKEIGLGIKLGAQQFGNQWSMVIDAYRTIMPIRSGEDGLGLYAGAYFPRSWYASDAFGNTLFVCYIPRVILPGDPESSGGINFSYRGFPNGWNGGMHWDQFPDGIQIAQYVRADGTIIHLSDVFGVPGDHIGWKFAGVF